MCKRLLTALTAPIVATAVLLVPQASEAATAPGPVVALPFSTESAAGPATGGAGSSFLNGAVARKCNGGTAVAGQQWFTLPTGDLGRVLVRGQGLYLYRSSRNYSEFTSTGVAVVDHVTGAVLSCGGGPVTITASSRAAVVVYLDAAELDACRSDEYCGPIQVRVFANRTSGVPANDTWADAREVRAVPFTGSADNLLADADGPNLLDTTCPRSDIDPRQYATVWWRYTPATSGDVKLAATAATYPGTAGEPLFRPTVGVARLTDDGPVKVVRGLDEDGCETGPVTVTAGTTYLLAVYQRYDEYAAGPLLVPGARVTLRVAAPVPSAPSEVTPRRGNGRVAVRWAAASNSATSGITGYRIRRYDASGTRVQASTTVAATPRSFTATGLTNGTGYRFDVTAVNAAGPGTPSPKSAVVTPAARPGSPTAFAATKDDGARTVTITWSPPASDGGSAITGYRVARDGTDSGGTGAYAKVVAASTRSFTFKYLNAWDTYTVTVRAINAVGAGRAAAAAVTITAPTPSAPASVAATPDTGAATITWGAPAETGTSAITGYRIRRFAGTTSTVQATTTVPAHARSVTMGGFTNGTAYTFDVTAINASGAGRVSGRTAPVTSKG